MFGHSFLLGKGWGQGRLVAVSENEHLTGDVDFNLAQVSAKKHRTF